MELKDNSNLIEKGDTFIALRCENDGHDYIEDAIKNGASKIICEYGSYKVDTILVNNTHDYLVDYLKDNYYDKIKDINLIGITGTNGKTTTAYLLYQALNLLGIKTAYIGTIGFFMEEKVKDLNNTTPDILELYNMLLLCKDNNIQYVVMEVSSHALDKERVKGLKFKYGVFTNLTIDHLDYHKNMDNYIKAKQKLFDLVTDKSFINIDDKYKNYFLKDNSITIGIEQGDYKISNYNMSIKGTNFYVNDIEYNISLIGKHNIYNITNVIAILSELNLNLDVIKELVAPPGRMEIINHQDNLVIVDYAHTPDALENIILTVKELNPNQIITIIGCGGNRDKTKRPIMGEIATNLSDFVIFTSDNPRCENPNLILNDIVKDLDKNNFSVIEKRDEAIKKGIQTLIKNDILLVLGKGHEKYQIINNVKYHFDDIAEVYKNM